MLNKVMLFSYYKRTDSCLRSDLIMVCIDCLKYLLGLKLIMGLAAFTFPQIWETKDEPSPLSFVSTLKIDLHDHLQSFTEKRLSSTNRLNKGFQVFDFLKLIHQQWYLFFSIGLIGLYLFQKVLLKLFVIVMTAAGNAILGCLGAIKKKLIRCFYF